MAAARDEGGGPGPARRRRLSRPVVFGHALASGLEQQRQRALAAAASLPPLAQLPADLQRSVFAFTGRNSIQDFRLVSRAAERSLHDVLDARVKWYVAKLRQAGSMLREEGKRVGWIAVMHPAGGGQPVGFFDIGDRFGTEEPSSNPGPPVYPVYYGYSLSAVLHNVLSDMAGGEISGLPTADYAAVAPILFPDDRKEELDILTQHTVRMLPADRITGYYPGWFARDKQLFEQADATVGRNDHEKWFNVPELIRQFHTRTLTNLSYPEQQFFIETTDPVTGAIIDFYQLLVPRGAWLLWNDVVEKYAVERALHVVDHPTLYNRGPDSMPWPHRTATEEEQRDAARQVARN